MADNKPTLWERMCKTGEKNNLITIDADVALEAYMGEMPVELKEKKIGDVEALGELGTYNRNFGYSFASNVMPRVAQHVKDNEEIQQLSVSFTSPLGIEYGADFARPTTEDPDEETWGQSFVFKQGLDYDERITGELRSTIGNLFSASDDEE